MQTTAPSTTSLASIASDADVLPSQVLPAGLNQQLLERFNIQCPRYTSYPTAADFTPLLDTDAQACIKALENNVFQPLSLYLHIPFCEKLCLYCACNKVITKKHSRADAYIDVLIKEMALYSQGNIGKRVIKQLHLGGGTPNFLNESQLTRLMTALSQHFNLSHDKHREFSIELDPRFTSTNQLALLKGLGFNRISFGVQDFNPDVQIAIGREHSLESIQALVNGAKALGFNSVNIDLLYGLPLQTQTSFTKTLKMASTLNIDRIALYQYAHMPQQFKHQALLNDFAMPGSADKIQFYFLAKEQLLAAGFEMLGMDHFVKADDSLFKAKQRGELQRNFQGYSLKNCQDLLGLGVSSISQSGQFLWQNQKSIKDYTQAVEIGESPISTGVKKTADDHACEAIIMDLMTRKRCDIGAWENNFDLKFKHFFAENWPQIRFALDEKLLILQKDKVITISAKGLIFMRQLSALFDKRRLQNSHQSQNRFSKAL